SIAACACGHLGGVEGLLIDRGGEIPVQPNIAAAVSPSAFAQGFVDAEHGGVPQDLLDVAIVPEGATLTPDAPGRHAFYIKRLRDRAAILAIYGLAEDPAHDLGALGDQFVSSTLR